MARHIVPRETIEHAVGVACRAPSHHNSQPWRWVAEPGGLHLYADRDRLVATDHSGRQALIGCGAVLDHLRVVLTAAGWSTSVDYCPEPDNPTLLASLGFAAAADVTAADRRRADAVLWRRTDRLPFGPVGDWGLDLDQVVRGSAAVSVLTEDARPRLVEASQFAEALRLYDTAYHAELDWWTSPFEVTDGIPQSALVSAAESDRVDVGRSFPVTRHRERRMEVPEDQSRIVVLSALTDTREDVLHCGEALSAILLECTLAGLATCTLTHVTEAAASREMVAALTGRPHPQVLVRVGRAPALEEVPPPTPRRPVCEVLEFTVGAVNNHV
jgi:hypothetical protein